MTLYDTLELIGDSFMLMVITLTAVVTFFTWAIIFLGDREV